MKKKEKYEVQTRDRLCVNCDFCDSITEKHKLNYLGVPFLGYCKLKVKTEMLLIHTNGCLESQRQKAYINIKP